MTRGGSGQHVDKLRLEARRQVSARACIRIGKSSRSFTSRASLPIAPIGRQVIAADLRNGVVAPLEKTSRLVDRVDHVSNLERLCEKVLVNEQIVMRQKDSKAGVSMIPTHDIVVRESLVALACDFFPRIMRVCKAGLGIGVMLGFERMGNPNEGLSGLLVETFLAQQDAAQFDSGIGKRVPLDRVRGLAIEEYRQVGRAGDLVRKRSKPAIAVGP